MRHNLWCANAKGMDIIDIVQFQHKCNITAAINKLLDYYNMSIYDKDFFDKQSEKYSYNFNLLHQKDYIKTNYPKLHYIMRYGYLILNEILSIGLESIVNKYFLYNEQNLFFFSNRYLAKKINKPYVTINKYINLFCVLGLIQKVDHKEINKTIRRKSVEIAKKNGQHKINFYIIPKYTKDILSTSNNRAEFMLNNGFTIRGMSKQFIKKCFDDEFANKIYSIPIKNSKFREDIAQFIENIILNNIDKYGYCTKDMIINERIVVGNKYVYEKTIDHEFKKIIPEILQKYDFLYVRSNKRINDKLGINTRKKLIIPSSILES
jgi:hypothetical protein